MSFQAMAWACAQSVPATQKIVLLMLANRTNHDTGKCIPKIKTLAEECGMSETAAKTAIKHLADAGIITVQNRFHDGVQLPNQYILHMGGVGREATGGGSGNAPGVGRQTPTEPGSSEPVIEPGSPNGSRLPRDWALPEDWAEFCEAERPDLDAQSTGKQFADYWHAVPGAKGRKLDWLATWRNWVRGQKSPPNKQFTYSGKGIGVHYT